MNNLAIGQTQYPGVTVRFSEAIITEGLPEGFAAEEMSARYSIEDPLRRLQLFTTVIKEAAELARTRRNQ